MNILRKNRKSNYKYNRKLFVRIMLFIFSLIFATFAWVTYTNILDDVLNFHMVSWDLEYYSDTNGDGTPEKITNPLNVSVPVLYPQMSEKDIEVTIRNNGDAIIDLSYNIQSIEILGNTYEIVSSAESATTEYYIIPGNTTVSSNVSTQDLLNDDTKFPFSIIVESATVIQGETDANLTIKITWDPLGRNDELDTEWGHDVAKYMQEHNDSPIKIILQVNAIQAENQ